MGTYNSTRISERRKALFENFMKYHKEGKTIREIAEMFDLSITSVYNSLGEIAKEYGVEREDLLQKPITRTNESNCESRSYCKVVVEEINQKLDDMISMSEVVETQIEEMIAQIDETINASHNEK